MKSTEQYKIYIGYADSQTREQYLSEEELLGTVSSYFRKYGIEFSISHCKGGYFYNNGQYRSELTMVVNIIGRQGVDIIQLAKGLSMFMNQEHVLITRTVTETRFV